LKNGLFFLLGQRIVKSHPDNFQSVLVDDPPAPSADIAVCCPLLRSRFHFITFAVARVKSIALRFISTQAFPAIRFCFFNESWILQIDTPPSKISVIISLAGSR
jgi:hypothetical protein